MDLLREHKKKPLRKRNRKQTMNPEMPRIPIYRT